MSTEEVLRVVRDGGRSAVRARNQAGPGAAGPDGAGSGGVWPGGRAAGGAGLWGSLFGPALRAEWTKLWTTGGAAWLLAGVVPLTAGVSWAVSAGCGAGGCGLDPVKGSLVGVQLGQTVVAALAVLILGTEFGTGTIGPALAAVPRREVLLAAKATLLTGLVLAASALALLGCVLTTGLDLGDGATARAVGGSVLYLTLVALLGLGVTGLVRDSVAALGGVLGLLFLFPIVAGAVTDPVLQRHLQQVSPMMAGLAIQATTDLPGLPIQPWQGLGVLALWAAGALLLGGLSFRRADA